jgi:Tfp pilus assembly protein PilV
MKISLGKRCKATLRNAFSMIDVLVSMGIIGVTVTSLYAGFSLGFSITESARENLRATQIIMEKFETLRLYTWDQINSNGFLPPTFTSPYAFNDTNSGFLFNGQLTITNAARGASYDSDMRMVTVRVDWRTGGLPDGPRRTRQMTTLVSRYGLQTYVY